MQTQATKPYLVSSLAVLFWLLTATTSSFGQERTWTFEAQTPEGYRDSGGAARRVFNRLLAKTSERSRIELRILPSTAASVADFLNAEKSQREELKANSTTSRVLAERTGKQCTFCGPFEFGGEKLQAERTVAVVRLSKGQFLRLTSFLIFPKDEPSADLIRNQTDALQALTKSIRLKSVKTTSTQASALRSTKSEGLTSPDSTEPKLYARNEPIPFTFEFPASWYVADEDAQAPGSVWVIATPFNEAQYGNFSRLEAALRITVIGHVPELMAVKNELEVATQIVTQKFSVDEFFQDTEVSLEKTALMKNAQGQLIRYKPLPGQEGVSGRMLVVAVDGALLIADFQWPSGEDETYEKQAIDILNSFKIESLRNQKTIRQNGLAFSYPSESWNLAEVATNDRSKAWSLRQNETELFLRSMPLTAEQSLDNAQLASVCSSLLGRYLELEDSDALKDASQFFLPGTTATWHALLIERDRVLESFAMVRDQALHLAVLTTTQGIRDHTFAQALTIFSSMKADPAKEANQEISLAAFFKKPRKLTSIQAEAFDIDGRFQGHARQTLSFSPGGTVKFEERGFPNRLIRGSFAFEDDTLVITLEDAKMRLVELAPYVRFYDESNRIWHLSHDL